LTLDARAAATAAARAPPVVMRLIVVVVPLHLAASAQALYALGTGLASALVVLPSDYFYAQFGAQAFLLMALLCATAIVPARRLTAPAAPNS
jgi:hypothetical protein